MRLMSPPAMLSNLLSPIQLPIAKLSLLSLLLVSTQTWACTTIAVGKDASTDGSVLTSHSNDGEGDTDPRLVLIPASDWPDDAQRPVFYSPESFPRYVGPNRATSPVETYAVGNGDNGPDAFKPICHIPQVSHTYQYYEETYGAINEKQLGISESTCSGVFGAAPKGISYPDYGVGKACFSVDTLTQIAMERHSKARDAIAEIGQLAEEYGFYGAGLFEGSAESLIIADTEEVWIFHILPDATGASAIWVAQRVPSDSFAVVPNVFIIREIDPDDSENFLYSKSVYRVATELGWWDKSDGNLLDFTAMYSDGEYSHKYYSGRRSWGVYKLFAPSLELEADYLEWRISKPFPFAAAPDMKVSVADVANAMRSYYEGTEYSQAGESSGLNLAGGPFRAPDHVSGGNSTPFVNIDGKTDSTGNWERTIGLYRTSDSYITQARGWLPDANGAVLWYAPYAAPYSVFTPFAAGMKSLPHATLGNHMRLDKKTLFWAFRYLGNYVQLKYEHMIREVAAFQKRTMEANLELQEYVDGLIDEGERIEKALELYSTNANNILAETWDLCDHLMFKFADGQLHSTPTNPQHGTSTPPRQFNDKGVTTKDAEIVDQPGYRSEWLESVGFLDGPPPPPDCSDLEWECGHKPSSPASEHGLRGEIEGVDASANLSAPKQAMIDYQQKKQRALNSNTSTCASVGDVAAAVKRCSKTESKQGHVEDSIAQVA